jgi:uncharacterized protein YcfJ
MKTKITFSIFLATVLLLAGCESMGPKTKTGALAGGVIGAGAGGIIGQQMHRGAEGAVIGAALGALSGGLIGNQWDKMDTAAKATNPNYLAITGIVDMASKGVPDDVIISEIQRTHSTYRLTSEVITYLKQNKVSDKVVNFMLATAG